jgi:hypothetical protein
VDAGKGLCVRCTLLCAHTLPPYLFKSTIF